MIVASLIAYVKEGNVLTYMALKERFRFHALSGKMWLLTIGAFFHAFKWWDILPLIPVTLILTFLVWRLKNNTIGIVLHFLINGIGLFPIIIGILNT